MSALAPTLLVVGGTGFIGAHIVARARTLGWEVTSLGVSRPSAPPAAGIRAAQADIADPGALRRALPAPQFDFVVNCGGYIDHSLYTRGGKAVFGAQFLGPMNLVDLLDRGRLKSFVNLGSSDEYGGAPAPQVESQREQPISPYSAGKAAATHVLQMLHRTEGFPATTLRLFLTYGPGQGGPRFLPSIIRACLTDSRFPASAGGQLRDFCFVADVVDAVFAALNAEAARGEVINVASGEPQSIRQMIERICRLTGGGTPEFGAVAYRPGENMELYADVSKARQILGWRPQTGLDEGLARTIAWVRSNL